MLTPNKITIAYLNIGDNYFDAALGEVNAALKREPVAISHSDELKGGGARLRDPKNEEG